MISIDIQAHGQAIWNKALECQATYETTPTSENLQIALMFIAMVSDPLVATALARRNPDHHTNPRIRLLECRNGINGQESRLELDILRRDVTKGHMLPNPSVILREQIIYFNQVHDYITQANLKNRLPEYLWEAHPITSFDRETPKLVNAIGSRSLNAHELALCFSAVLPTLFKQVDTLLSK